MNRRAADLLRAIGCAWLAWMSAGCDRDRGQAARPPETAVLPWSVDWRAALVAGTAHADFQRRVSDHPEERPQMLVSLAGLLDDPDPAVRFKALSVLTNQRPCEIADSLAARVRHASDPEWAAALLSALREATRAETGQPAFRVDEGELAGAFEVAQQSFRAELRDPDNHPLRLEEALRSIADVFPADEGDRWFAEIDERQRGRRQPVIREAALHALWLEFKVGAAAGSDFGEIVRFVRQHPHALGETGAKERLVDMLRIAPVPPVQAREAYDELVSMIEPDEAVDDSYVRWLNLKSDIAGKGNADWLRLLPELPPMRQAALIHFADIDFGRSMDPASRSAVRDRLQRAAETQSDAERRAFLNDAAEALENRPPAE